MSMRLELTLARPGNGRMTQTNARGPLASDQLETARLNRDNAVPLYAQIRAALLDHAGGREPGTMIPSETQLAERFSTSRMTVRQAVNSLVEQGVLHRRQGVGTFVLAPKAQQDLSSLLGFSEEMRRRGLEVSNRLVTRRRTAPSAHVAQQLRLRPRREVVILERVRLVDGVPMALETAHLPASRFGGLLEEADLERESLFDLLERAYGCRIAGAEHAIEPVNADARSAGLLDIAPGTALIKMEGCNFDTGGEPVEYVEGLYRGDRYRLGLSLRRVRSPMHGE